MPLVCLMTGTLQLVLYVNAMDIAHATMALQNVYHAKIIQLESNVKVAYQDILDPQQMEESVSLVNALDVLNLVILKLGDATVARKE